MIKLRCVTFSYDENTVPIKDFSYVFYDGVYAVTGPSGCGKSTLMKGIAGLLKPISGSITTDGERLSMVFQENRLITSYSAERNLRLVSDSREESEAVLKSVGLYEFRKKPVSELSGGQQRRCAVARAVLYGGDCIILDEPFEGLDMELRRKIAAMIAEKFSTIIISSHDASDIALFGSDIRHIQL